MGQIAPFESLPKLNAISGYDLRTPVGANLWRSNSASTLRLYLSTLGPTHHANVADDRTIRLITRSLDSDCAKSIWNDLAELRETGIKLLVILADFAGSRRERAALHKYTEIFGKLGVATNIRYAKLRRRERILEQIQLGNWEAWSESTADDLTSLAPETNDQQSSKYAIAAARVSFEMMWAISNRIAL